MGARAASSILALCLLLPSAACPAQGTEPGPASPLLPPVRFEPSAYFAKAGEAAEPLDAAAFVDLSVGASLVEPEDGSLPSETGNAAKRIIDYVEGKARSLRLIESLYDRGAEALAVLHRERLRIYRAEQTRVDLAMESGVFNCVSSAVLYLALAKASGLEACGVETDDHAFAMVGTEKGWIDVETTNAAGFDPGKRKETFTDSFGRITGYAYVPPEQYAKRSRVGDKAMAGLILHNRISVLEADGLFRDSFCLAVERIALEGADAMGDFILLRAANYASRLIADNENESALAFLDAFEAAFSGGDMVEQAREVAIRNRLADLSRSGKYAEGYEFILRARAAWGEQAVFREFDAAAVKNQAIDLMKAGEFGKALDFLDGMEREERGSKADYPGLRENAALGMVNAIIRAGDFPGSLKLIDSLSVKGYLGASKRKESLKSAAGAEANRRAKADQVSGWLSAKEAFDAALAYLPGDPDLLKNGQACLDNYATSVYNRFAAAYNARDAAEAVRILKEGLSRYPDSPLLKKHLAEIEPGPN